MTEMVQRRNTGMGITKGAMPRIDDILDGYYQPGPERKHKSPTKRLIKLKDSTWAHKKRIQSGIAKGEYSQTYCISPGKSYVIEAQGGELPYEMAQTSPSKFYSQVLHQDIKKYRIKMRGKLTFEWTQRPLLRILTSIKNKLIERIGEQIGKQFSDDIAAAMGPGTKIEGMVKNMMQNEEIDLLDENQNPILQQEIDKRIAREQEKHEDGDESVDSNELDNSININVAPAETNNLDAAALKVSEQKFSDLSNEVIDYVRRNSLLKGAKNL